MALAVRYAASKWSRSPASPTHHTTSQHTRSSAPPPPPAAHEHTGVRSERKEWEAATCPQHIQTAQIGLNVVSPVGVRRIAHRRPVSRHAEALHKLVLRRRFIVDAIKRHHLRHQCQHESHHHTSHNQLVSKIDGVSDRHSGQWWPQTMVEKYCPTEFYEIETKFNNDINICVWWFSFENVLECW